LSNTIGAYTLAFLPTGPYQVEVELRGFEKALRRGITLGADQKVDLAFTLTPGNITETVTVSESSPLVNRVSTEVGESLQHKTVVDLPLNGRNFASLVYLTPGVQTGRVGEQAAGGGPSAWRSNVAFNANGMRATTNSYLLDGIDNNELGLDFTISVLPVVDAIQEFKVQTNNFSAEFGRALGGILSVTLGAVRMNCMAGFTSFFATPPSTPATSSLLLVLRRRSARTSSGAPSEDPSARTSCSSSAIIRGREFDRPKTFW
jgi:hypothetical protein